MKNKTGLTIASVLIVSIGVRAAWISETVDKLSENNGHGDGAFHSLAVTQDLVFATGDDYGKQLTIYLKQQNGDGTWTTVHKSENATFPFLAANKDYVFMAEQRVHEDGLRSCRIKRYSISTGKTDTVYDPGLDPKVCRLVAPPIIDKGWLAVHARYVEDSQEKVQFLISADQGDSWKYIRNLPVNYTGIFKLVPLDSKNFVMAFNDHPTNPGVTLYKGTLENSSITYSKFYTKADGRIRHLQARTDFGDLVMLYTKYKDGARDGSDRVEVLSIKDGSLVNETTLPSVSTANFSLGYDMNMSADKKHLAVVGWDSLKSNNLMYSVRELDLVTWKWSNIDLYFINDGGSGYSAVYDPLSGGIISGGTMTNSTGTTEAVLRRSTP